MKTSDLIEQRAAIVTRINEAAEKVVAAHKADDDVAFGTAKREQRAAEAEFSTVEAQIAESRSRDDADRRDPGTVITGGTDEHLDRELRSFSLRNILAHAAGMNVDAGRELELQGELAKRAGAPAKGFYVPTEIFETRTQLTTNSGATVQADYRPDLFVSALTNSSVLAQMGATTLTGLTGDVVIPRETDSPQVGWVKENEALPYDDAAFDSLTLTPHHVGVITEISRQMLQQSSPAIEQLIRQMQARNIGLELDRAGLAGTGGSSAQPLGLLNDPAIPTEAFVTTGANYGQNVFLTTANMIAKADVANVSSSRSFLATTGVKGSLSKIMDADGHAIPVADQFHGEPVQFSNQAPSNLAPAGNKHALIYGDWADFLIGIWSQIDVLVNPYAQAAYEKGNILVRTMATADFGVRRPASFVKATGVLGA